MIKSLILRLDIIKPLCQKTTEGAGIMEMEVFVCDMTRGCSCGALEIVCNMAATECG